MKYIVAALLFFMVFDVFSQSGQELLLPVETKAPDWVLLNSDKMERKLSDFKGKVVLLDFWATWCPPCLRAQPFLQGIHEKYDDVVVIGMDFNERKRVDLNTYKAKRNISYEMMYNSEKIGRLYKINVLPTLYIIDKSGKIAYSSFGYSEKDEDRIIAAIEKIAR